MENLPLLFRGGGWGVVEAKLNRALPRRPHPFTLAAKLLRNFISLGGITARQ